MSITAFKQPFFTYSALEDDSEWIRLIAILPTDPSGPLTCFMREQSLSRDNETFANTFYALSYCWGKLTERKRWIYVNGRRFQVQPALFQALQATRLICAKRNQAPGWLWVDAVCIDQCNIKERSIQVSLMAQIYGKAAGVFAWLGPSDDATNEAIEWMRTYANDDNDYESRSQPGDRVCDSIIELCNRNYWTRAWVQQELFFSQSLYLLCGDSYVSWDDFWLASVSPVGMEERALETYAAYFLKGNRTIDSIELGHRQTTLEDLICDGPRGRACSDPRDGVFSLLSMASDMNREQKTLEADYAISKELLYFGVLNICNAQNSILFVTRLAMILRIARSKLIEALSTRHMKHSRGDWQSVSQTHRMSVWESSGRQYIQSRCQPHILNNGSLRYAAVITPAYANILFTIKSTKIGIVFQHDALGLTVSEIAMETLPRRWKAFEMQIDHSLRHEMSEAKELLLLGLKNGIPKGQAEGGVTLRAARLLHRCQQTDFLFLVLNSLRHSRSLCHADCSRIASLLHLHLVYRGLALRCIDEWYLRRRSI